MPHPTARPDLACRNCGAPAPLKFCPECGQETTLHPPTLGEFLHEFVGHYVALEGPLWRTLRLLLTRPGQLTREYLQGRRRQYVLPLRLYLTMSFLFFLALKMVPWATDNMVVVDLKGRHVATVAEIEAAAPSQPALATAPHRPTSEPLRPVECGGASQPACSRAEALVNAAGDRLGEHPQETVEHMRAHALGMAPYAVFLLMPVFAGFMMLAYRNRRMTYGEHVVFSLHLQAFWFLALLVGVIADPLAGIVQLLVPVYGVWAMHTAYGGRWGTTLLRAVFVSVLYGATLAAASVGLVAILVALG